MNAYVVRHACGHEVQHHRCSEAELQRMAGRPCHACRVAAGISMPHKPPRPKVYVIALYDERDEFDGYLTEDAVTPYLIGRDEHTYRPGDALQFDSREEAWSFIHEHSAILDDGRTSSTVARV